LAHRRAAPAPLNLACYLALRRHDISDLQKALSRLGLSPLDALQREQVGFFGHDVIGARTRIMAARGARRSRGWGDGRGRSTLAGMTTPTLLTEPVPPYGAVLTVHPRIRRVVARNPGPMTCHGTSSWIVGHGKVAVIDPGPDDPAHRRALIEAVAGETVTHVIVTHGHHDHSAGAMAFAAATGARSWGFGRPDAARTVSVGAGHPPFLPDEPLAEGSVLEGPEWRLVAIHTPGHASDHLCFSLAGEGILFSGDHVMGWATSMVSPPDGDMAAYMASLERLLGRDEAMYLPGHGPAITTPQAHVAALLAHRRAREAAVLAAVRAGHGRAEAIVPHLYPGLAEPLVRPASRSVLAHLLKLAAEGTIVADQPGGETFRSAN
jgi:glyoxylase-like metal-dependent hydrolase (beta-lactamase superfamily II)